MGLDLKYNPVLYVKSEKIPLVEYGEGVPGHPCTIALRTTQTIYNYKSEDQKAMDLLKEAGIAYKLVDLSDCSFTTQLKAKIIGVNKTPTMVLNNRKIKGAQNIRHVLEEIKT